MARTLRRLLRKDGSRSAGAAHAPSWFEVRRPHCPAVGLAREFLRDPAQVAAVDSFLAPLLNDAAVRAAIERDAVPIPAAEDREGYFDDRHLAYWLSGQEDLRMLRRFVPAEAMPRVLDFGGATGRLARHLALDEDVEQVTVAELNVNHVAWIDRHMGPTVRGVKVSPYPQFPLADRSATLCVALSVFTHIDSYESGWLAEIHRVLADGGYALLTIHSEHTWPLIAERPGLLAGLRKDPQFDSLYRPQEPMPGERLVFAWNRHSIEHNCNVFFHSDYIRRVWGKWFDVVAVQPRAHHDVQTVVLLRKPPA